MLSRCVILISYIGLSLSTVTFTAPETSAIFPSPNLILCLHRLPCSPQPLLCIILTTTYGKHMMWSPKKLSYTWKQVRLYYRFIIDTHDWDNEIQENIYELFFLFLIDSAGLIFLTSFLTINFLNLATCICLIAGALQKRKNFLVPYIILTTLYILIYVALATWFFVKSSENSLRNGVISVVVIVVNIYCLIVVHQLYRLLKLREQNYPAFLRETNRQQQQAQNYETTYVKIP